MLGPRSTGKSYAVQDLSPYGALLTGPTTVPNMFGHMNGRQKGMVSIWDVVAFDEVADLQTMPKEVITTLKTYCESGTFQRGKEADSGEASIAMFGNTNQPVDVMVQTGHLFAPMPGTGSVAIPISAVWLQRQPFVVEVAVLPEDVRQQVGEGQAGPSLGPGQGVGRSSTAAGSPGHFFPQQCHGRHFPGV